MHMSKFYEGYASVHAKIKAFIKPCYCLFFIFLASFLLAALFKIVGKKLPDRPFRDIFLNYFQKSHTCE